MKLSDDLHLKPLHVVREYCLHSPGGPLKECLPREERGGLKDYLPTFAKGGEGEGGTGPPRVSQ